MSTLGSREGPSASFRIASGIALTLGVLLICAPPSVAQSVAIPPIPAIGTARGEVIVRFQPGTSEEARDRSLAAVNGTFVDSPLVQKDVVIARVPVGSEASSAASLAVDPAVVEARPLD